MASILHSPTSPKPRVGGNNLTAWWLIGGGTIVAWAYLVAMAWGMDNMEASAEWLLMPRMMGWGLADLGLVFVMWAVMMAGMMLPSLLPLLQMLRRIDQVQIGEKEIWLRTLYFVSGYLAVWTTFSVVATFAQWGLLELRLVSPMMVSSSTVFSGILLVLAGTYQFSSLKHACLQRCRSPLGFLLTQKIENRFLLGWSHGSYCAGCCWLIMVLLFVFGVMNLLWIFALTAIVFLEKFLRNPRWFSYATGLVFFALGGFMLWPGIQ